MKVRILIPAYNCAHLLPEVCARVPLSGDDEIIVADDGSTDGTFEVARSLPRVFAWRRPVNRGYGRTSADLYRLALERGADVTVNIHADLGHRPEDIPLLLDELKGGGCDIVVGSRLLHMQQLVSREGWLSVVRGDPSRRMPVARLLGQMTLTWIQNRCFHTDLHSFHDGMRACTRRVVEWAVASERSSWYTYDTEFLVDAHRYGFRIREVPVAPSNDPRARRAAPPIRYGLRILQHALSVAVGRR